MNNTFAVPPFFIFGLTALLVYLLKGRIRDYVAIAGGIVGAANVLAMNSGTFWSVKFLDLAIVLLKVDNISLAFGYIFSLITVLALLYAFNFKSSSEKAFALLYAGSSLNAVFAGDLITLFIFWEIMAISSSMLIFYNRNEESITAGYKYFVLHILGGSLLLAAIAVQYISSGTIEIGIINNSIAQWLFFLGIGLNTAFIGLHTWLPDSYPRATIAGAVFMSVFTTKTGVYALVRVFSNGSYSLLIMGAIMILYGVAFALMQNNIRKLLSYHIISQVGYMVAAIGIGTELGMNGSIAHVINHILYKALLFMCMGTIIYCIGIREIDELGGLYKKMPLLAVITIVASLSIAGVPGFNGYISKEIIVEAAMEKHLIWLEIILLLGSVGTLLSFLKLSFFTFFGKEKEFTVEQPPASMMTPMAILAILCVAIGIYPKLLGLILPFRDGLDIDFYGLKELLPSLQLVTLTAALFFFFIKSFTPHKSFIIDFDYIIFAFYSSLNKALKPLIRDISSFGSSIYQNLAIRLQTVNFHQPLKLATSLQNIDAEYPEAETPRQAPAPEQVRITPSGNAVLIVITIFSLYLLIYIIWTIISG